MRKLLLLAILILMPTLTLAQSAGIPCGKRGYYLEQLADKYKEVPVSMGLVANGSVLEVVKSEAGTWTIMITNAKGVTCLIAAGENWENIQPKKTYY